MLNEVVEKKLEIERLLLESEGEITDSIKELIDSFELDFKSKMIYLIDKYNSENLESNFLKQKKELIEGKIRSREKTVEFWKNNIDYLMRSEKISKLDIDVYNISYRKSENVVIENMSIIPDEYKEVKETISINKNDLKKFLKDGVIIPGCSLKTNENIQIK